MKPDKVPETVQAIVAQAGGLGMRGAFVYVGARNVTYQCARSEGEYRSDHPSRLGVKRGHGCVEFDVGVKFDVNGRRGRAWKMIIAYEPDDTYTVWLVEGHSKRQLDSMVLACKRTVHCDELQSVIESIYDEAVRKHNRGFIPLS